MPERAPAPPGGRPTEAADGPPDHGTARRTFLGWVLAAPTLVVGASVAAESIKPRAAAAAGIPSPPEVADGYDLGDLQDDSAAPTADLITITIGPDGTASFALPRAEVGQGITTSTAMTIADELEIPLSKVNVTLADARPELVFNQLTGGSNTTRSTYMPVRRAAALARTRLTVTAAQQWNVSPSDVYAKDGVVHGPNGRQATYGSLATAAAAATVTPLQATLKPDADLHIVGTPQNRVDALAAVTGRKPFTLDLDVPNALPTMVARPPDVRGTPNVVKNLSAVRKMPGVTHVAKISTGVAVRAATFGQCIDAIRALKVTWNPGPVAGESDESVLAKLRAAELPLAVPEVPVGATTIDSDYVFSWRSNSPLETGAAIANYTPQGIEVWSSLKTPIPVVTDLAQKYGMSPTQIKVHVVTGGGSFGRHLFSDAAFEAVEASKAFGKPVKLMWSRTDDFRQGRVHPLSTSRTRVSYLAGNVLSYEQRHTSVATDYSHGLGEAITVFADRLPIAGNYSVAQGIWFLTQTVSYNYGVTTQLLNETYEIGDFATGAMRNVYSPDSRVAQELTTEKIAKLAGMDSYQFRRAFIKNERGLAVLDKVAQVGKWGKRMPKGTAQGIAVHNEYKGWCACLVEIDCRPRTVKRDIYDAYTGPRVTKVTFAVDVGKAINPRGLEAQIQGGIMDGIAQTLTSSLHLQDGYFLEGSWDDYFYTREWNVPPQVNVIIMPDTSDSPGGAGEFGVAATMAATALAYGRATGTMPTRFPINYPDSVSHFEVFPTSPSTPQSPTDGLDYAY